MAYAVPHCKCLLAEPGATKHNGKLPDGQAVWRAHREASQPGSHLWNRVPEGDVSLQVGRAGCLLGWLWVSSLGEIQPACVTKPLGKQMGIQRLGRDCRQRVGISG